MSERLAYPLFPLIWGWGIRFWGQKGPQTNNFWPTGALNEHFLTFLCFWPFFIKKMQYPVVLFQLIAQYMLSTDEYFSLSAPHVNFPIIGGPGLSIKPKKLEFCQIKPFCVVAKDFFPLSTQLMITLTVLSCMVVIRINDFQSNGALNEHYWTFL